MSNYLIREIQENDLDELMLLIEEHTAYEQAVYNGVGKKERLQKELFRENSQLKCWVIEIDNKVNGFCSFTYDYSTWDAAFFIYMDCLYIRSSFRGIGIGSVILARLKVLAAEKQYVNVQWQTPDFNAPAIAFYKKNGALSKDKVRFTLSVDSKE
ncbi:L-amino acid N-acyltransferase YncA [Mucilaginibacter frigoritolerans]|uniref:L-amino acid N-acyltransferase YncA n=1 Tax=Mucilaginibacter frigoritolerans TaxID=652788 RepID=A0A562UCJ0_9SPHI|nr:GNAT family N-acetyltransferase [Mucilaginibacter frigoritolerans]TWJ03279.1 L-amino acid N-acyltransferase YncA [Mucilaginibacter frigoritolerans]